MGIQASRITRWCKLTLSTGPDIPSGTTAHQLEDGVRARGVGIHLCLAKVTIGLSTLQHLHDLFKDGIVVQSGLTKGQTG